MLIAMSWQTLVLLARALSTYWVDLPTTQRFDSGSLLHTVFVATFSFTILMVLIGAQLMASERVRQEFEHLARHDELTQLYNRRAILELVEQEHERFLRLGQPYALLLLDLDHFKRINDTFGHQTGDRTLYRMGSEVQQALRAVDRLGRYGGEEFLALLPASDLASARVLAERLRAHVQNLAPGPDNIPACTLSIGVATVQPTDTQWDTVLTRSDQALYQAKAAGRNRVEVG